MSWFGDDISACGSSGAHASACSAGPCPASVECTRQCGLRAVLVIGYGNTLRSDDGVGPAVVEHLAEESRGAPAVTFMAVHQLMPELAEDLSHYRRALFVDASVQIHAGKVAIQRVQAHDAQLASTKPLGHYASPEELLTLATRLYGRAPVAWSIGVGVSSLAVGERLSPVVARAANRLCRRLAYRIRQWCRTSEDCPIFKEDTHVCQ
jgi:hydrogenase maturation protease